MKFAIARRSFRRSDTKEMVRRGERVKGDARYIDELARLGMVAETRMLPEAPEQKANPLPAGGAERLSSASPAAQASPQTTAKRSAAGGKRKNKGGG